jgi:hypothetical protein
VIFNLIMLKFYLFSFLFVSDLICLLISFLYFCLVCNYCVISKFCLLHCFKMGVLGSFEELGKDSMSVCLTKTSFLVSF